MSGPRYHLETDASTLIELRSVAPGESIATTDPVTLTGWYRLAEPLADGCDRVWFAWVSGRLGGGLSVARPVCSLSDEQLQALHVLGPDFGVRVERGAALRRFADRARGACYACGDDPGSMIEQTDDHRCPVCGRTALDIDGEVQP